jgi:hypothetical protein
MRLGSAVAAVDRDHLAIGPCDGDREHGVVHRITTLALVALLLAACGQGAPTPASVQPSATPASTPGASAMATPMPTQLPGHARLEPADGAYFGVNLDWGNDSADAVSQRMGRTPAVWVQFVAFPLDDGGKANLDAFIDQVAAVHGMALITLEPNAGLSSVSDAAIADFASLVAGYAERDVRSFVRFAHEMNGSWYAWSQQPSAYVDAFRRVATAVHAATPYVAMIWAPNYGAGYPFIGGQYQAVSGSADFAALDADGDGKLTEADDPYAPYYPGDDAVDWVGMSLYHWGNKHPWGENEVPEPGAFVARLTGEYDGDNGDETAVPDFYAAYVVGHDKPLAITETAAFYDPAGPGPSEVDVKSAWWKQVFSTDVRERFPRLRMINWFEWRKQEPEVDAVIDWRISAQPALLASLLDALPAGWLRFAT